LRARRHQPPEEDVKATGAALAGPAALS